jgi:hypothetical protein
VHTAIFRKETTLNTRHRCEAKLQFNYLQEIGLGWGKDWIEWLRIGTDDRLL